MEFHTYYSCIIISLPYIPEVKHHYPAHPAEGHYKDKKYTFNTAKSVFNFSYIDTSMSSNLNPTGSLYSHNKINSNNRQQLDET